MKASTLAYYSLAVILLWTGQCSASEKQLIRNAVKAQKQFSQSIAAENWSKTVSMLYFQGINASDQDNVAKSFIQLHMGLHEAGITLSKEKVKKTEYFTDGNRHAVFLRMNAVYKHPLADNGKLVKDFTRVAISEDGKSWKFPSLSCFSEKHMKKLFKNYNGVPAFVERSNITSK